MKLKSLLVLVVLCLFYGDLFINEINAAATSSIPADRMPVILSSRRCSAFFLNSDGEINNYAYVKLNYTQNLSSSLSYYSRQYASLERNTTDDGDDVEKIDSIKRRDIRLNAIDYNFNIITGGGFRLAVSPEINIQYYDEEKIKESNATWDSDINPGTKEMYFERMRYNTRSFMPIAEAAITLSLTKNLSFIVGGGFLPVSFDMNRFNEFGSSTDADPALQREAYYEAEYNVDFTSMGYTLKGGVKIMNCFFGDIMVDLYYLYKFGDSIVSDRWWDYTLQKNVIEEYSAVDRRRIINLDVYYQLDFLTFRGIIPILKFGYLKQTVTLDNEERSPPSVMRHMILGLQ